MKHTEIVALDHDKFYRQQKNNNDIYSRYSNG